MRTAPFFFDTFDAGVRLLSDSNQIAQASQDNINSQITNRENNAVQYAAQGNQMQRFNRILPMLSGDTASWGAGGNGAGLSTASNNVPGGGQVLNPSQIQQQQNQNAATISQSAATQNQNIQNSTAGRGFGANSPLAMALTNANDIGARGQIASTNSQLGVTAAQMNALTYIEGEYKDYSSERRVMNELSAFCHMIDTWSARGWYNYPKAAGDEWPGAGRFRTT